VGFIRDSFGGDTLAGAEFLREAVRRMDVSSSCNSGSVRRMKKIYSTRIAATKEGKQEERIVAADEEEEQGQTEEEVEEEEEGEGKRVGRGRKTSLPSMTGEDMDRSSTNPPIRAWEEDSKEGRVVKGGTVSDFLSLSVDGVKAKKTHIAAIASAAAAVVAAAGRQVREEEGGHGHLQEGDGNIHSDEQKQQQSSGDVERDQDLQGKEKGREGGHGPGHTLSSHAQPFNSRFHTHHTDGNSCSGSKFDPFNKNLPSRPSLPPPFSTKPVAETAEEDVETSFFLSDALDHLPMTVVMLIPDTPAVLADIIGKGGSTVGDIQRLSGCQISIERTVHRGRERKVALMGSICAVSTAQQIIMGRVRHLEEQSGVGREYGYSHGQEGRKGGREGGMEGGLGLSSSSSSSMTSSSSSSTSNSPSLGPTQQLYQQQTQHHHHHHHPTWKDAQGCLKLKLCVPNCTVRHLIGRAGTVVSAIERESGCILKFQAEGEMEGGALGRMLEMLGGGYVAHAKACYHVCRKLVDDRTLPSTWRGGDVFLAKQQQQKLSKMAAGGVVGPSVVSPSSSGGGGAREGGKRGVSLSSLSGLASAFNSRGLLGGEMEGGSLAGLGGNNSFMMAKSLSLSSTSSNNSAASTSSSASSLSSSPVGTTSCGVGSREGGNSNTGMLAGAPSSHRHTQHHLQQHLPHEDVLCASSSLFPSSHAGAGGLFSGSLFLRGGGEAGGEGGWGAGDVMMIMEREKERERENKEREGSRDGESNIFGGSSAAATAAAAAMNGGKGVFTVVHVYVPNKAVSFLIGKGGINVTAIEKQSGARLEFTREASPPTAERLVNIKGNPAAVEIAEGLLEAKTLEWQTSPTLIR